MIKETNFYLCETRVDFFIKKNKIYFEDNLKTPDIDKESFIINGKECQNKKTLFKYFSIVLNFPDYFGNNWSAFNDCIASLDDYFSSTRFKIFIINPLDILFEYELEKKIFWEILSDLDKIDAPENPSGFPELYIDFILQVETEELKNLQELLNKYKINYSFNYENK